MIKLKRDSGYTDRLRAYKVFLDGEKIGEIKDGQEVKFEITPDEHKLHLEIDWCRSNTIEFRSNGNDIEFECGSNMRGLKVFLAFVYIMFLSDQYIWLKQKSSST